MKNNFTFLLDVVFNVVYSVIMNVKKGQQMQDQEIKIGTIFCKCWGYSMRLYDFYQVTKVSGKTFTFVKLEKNEQVGSESGRPIVTPIISSCAIAKMNGETFKKRLNKYGFFKDIGNTIWDGQPKIEDHWD